MATGFFLTQTPILLISSLKKLQGSTKFRNCYLR